MNPVGTSARQQLALIKDFLPEAYCTGRNTGLGYPESIIAPRKPKPVKIGLPTYPIRRTAAPDGRT
ncbi:hypothetical protein [Salmonirosea aquatica]|uniref:Uncharacterized protein n=1 Tax=Salmonirosea aquatica TaxID=2654236 RepID=A0A7C9BK31_9BACT|nr:hypothetical protein [Cytophagaceae bacterium SJW1-29]